MSPLDSTATSTATSTGEFSNARAILNHPHAPADWSEMSAYRLNHLGTGCWESWGPQLGPLESAIEDWATQLTNIEKPWLCWSVLDRFCRIQQRLTMEFGWTPVVGWDPRGEKPTILPGSVPWDVNRTLGLPTIWGHFPVEFVYRFAPRLAVWHSDLLLSRKNMEQIVRVFDSLDDGETAAYRPRGWRFRKTQPCPGLAACNTRGASQDQWEKGCGWWRWYIKHPNFPGASRDESDWDSVRGIFYWQKHYGGRVRRVFPDERGHCRAPWSEWKGRMTKGEAMAGFHDIGVVARELGIADLDE
jgi:hypothetical protein